MQNTSQNTIVVAGQFETPKPRNGITCNLLAGMARELASAAATRSSLIISFPCSNVARLSVTFSFSHLKIETRMMISDEYQDSSYILRRCVLLQRQG